MKVAPVVPLLMVLAASQGCTGAAQDPSLETDSEAELAEVGGDIFKGPFRAGGTITFTPQTDALQATGEVHEAVVGADDGSYEALIPSVGLVLVEALGYALDEARGDDGPAEIRLSAWAIAGPERPELHVNLLTDLIVERVRRLIDDGAAPVAAILRAEGELARALPLGTGEGPGARGTELGPYGDGYAQAWLFGVSAAIAQAGRDLEAAEGRTLGDLMDELRADLADDGALTEGLTQVLSLGEQHLDPDLATLALGTRLSVAGPGRLLPDLHAVLDTDHDGLVNRGDNCRYVPNPDQADPLGLGFGAACDERLLGVSVNDRWGCGLRARDGRPVCWDVAGLPTGGAPPAPDVFPAHLATPWDGEDKLTGSYAAISVGEQVICAVQASGQVHCDVDGVADELVLDGSYTQVSASRSDICALASDGSVSCFDTSGALLTTAPGPYADVDVFSEGGICVLHEDGALKWMAHPSKPDQLPPMPPGVWRAVDASESGAGCALSMEDGSLACFGSPALVQGAPPGSFAEVAVGSGVACAATSDGALSCWRDLTLCPEVEAPPPSLRDLSAGGCQVCGLDDQGIGRCWPRRWSVDHPAAP